MSVLAPEFFIKQCLNADYVEKSETIQSLWSGYGHISRYHVEHQGNRSSVILKAIDWKATAKHPRGWQSDLAHQRKVTSYQVEMDWYKNWSRDTQNLIRIPPYLSSLKHEPSAHEVLEDLDASG